MKEEKGEAKIGASSSTIQSNETDELRNEFMKFKAATEANFELVINLLQENYKLLESLKTEKEIAPSSPIPLDFPSSSKSHQEEHEKEAELYVEMVFEAEVEPKMSEIPVEV